MHKIIQKINKSPKFYRFYCDNKRITLIEADREEKMKKKTNNNVNDEDECAKTEARLMRQVLVEKEQDANLRSRLTKDCKIIFKESATKKFGSIRINASELHKESANWLSYEFDHFNNNKEVTRTADNSCKKTDEAKSGQKNDLIAESASSIGTPPSGPSRGSLPRPIRQEPAKVLLTFIPEEWWTNLFPKTGVTGLGTFFFTLSVFLVSKEYYVLEHNYYNGLGVLGAWILGIKYFGPHLAKGIDKEIDEYEKSWNESRENEKNMLNESIMDEVHLQFQMDGQLMLIEAKRENILLQLEEEYRIRQMYVYDEVKQRLDYHVAVELVKQRFQHRNLIEYVTQEVIKSITPEMETKLINYSIDQIMKELDNVKK